MNAIVGDWGDVFDTSIIGIHQVLLGDGRVLFWGGDGNGNAFSNTQKYGIFDPLTGQHEILEAEHVVRMFCGAGVILPGTDQVLIAGGNGSGAPGGQIFDTSDETLIRDSANDMATGRFYPTAISLSSGQVVIMGGNGNADLRGTPEIFTPGEGWRSLDGAADPDVAANWWYPRMWMNANGEIVYVAINAGSQNANPGPAGSFEVMALDPSGSGSIRKIGELPFQMDATSPHAMYDVGKIVIMDHAGDLWYMDINGDTPEFAFAADLGGDRNNSDMTVLPDGRILINGGTTVGNSQDPDNAVYESQIFDPYTGAVSTVDAEDVMRLYHSSSVLLPDGTILSMGGGGLNGTVDFMDAQIYSPDYLFENDGSLADRPEISAAPASVQPGDSFTITVDDASAIETLSFVKTGAVTHSVNMESGRMNLDFTVIDNGTIAVSLPENPYVLSAGNWMLFAIDGDGVPSVAPIISVEPTVPLYTEGGSAVVVDGTIEVDYFGADVSSLDEVDFDGAPIYSEVVTEIQTDAGTGAFYNGGPSNQFAARYTGEFLAPADGQYTFYLKSDDGSRLSIDGDEIINNDGLHAAVEKTATVFLEAGIHSLSADYFEQGGLAVMELDWSGPTFARSTFAVNGTEPTLEDEVQDVPNVTQYLNGVGSEDVFVIDGNAADYGWGATQDGEGTVVWGPTGHDLLYGFETIRFNDTDVALTAPDGEFQDVEGVTQILSGTDVESETFIINGNSSDYGWGTTEDGLGIVVWGPTGHDLLYNFDKIVFSDRTVELTINTGPDGGLIVQDDPGRTQYEMGTDKTDRFVIDADADAYAWDATQDGEGIVVWNQATGAHDLLYDFEEIAFNDQVVQLEQQVA